MSDINRRDFVKTTAGATAGALGFNTTKYAGSPNGTIRVGVVGLKGQGWSHTSNYLKMPNVQVAALCDIDDAQFARHTGAIEKSGKGGKPTIYKDIRKLLEDKSIDAISVATPNHWHSLMGIWALQAGKDIYLEKPCSQSYWEGKQLVAASKKYSDRIIQHGTNSRSGVAIREVMDKMWKEDLIGEVYYTRALCYKWRDTIGKKADAAVPAGVDYDMWLGPAPARPFNPNRFHYNWHWNWDYGNGDLGNQGIHEVDISRWGLGVTLPTKVHAVGGHFMFDDDQNTPNTMVCTYEFDRNGKKAIMVAEVRHWISNNEAGISDAPDLKMGEGGGRGGNTIGNVFYGSKGYVAIEGYTKYNSYLGKNQDAGPARQAAGNNWQNFIDVVVSRDKSKQNAPIEEGHYSCALVHLANISYQLGRSINFDPKTENVIGDKQAQAMLKRKYRAPYVVPEKV
ncbi:MAG: Gfo/Idh/MocA family oxidoreductase [Blastocatellia bacterium]